MLNWLNQEIEEGAVVYRGARQGLHGNMIGVVEKERDDGFFTVRWHFELHSVPVISDRITNAPGSALVRLDESALESLYRSV